MRHSETGPAPPFTASEHKLQGVLSPSPLCTARRQVLGPDLLRQGDEQANCLLLPSWAEGPCAEKWLEDTGGHSWGVVPQCISLRGNEKKEGLSKLHQSFWLQKGTKS